MNKTDTLEADAPAVPQEPNNDEVICPACCTQFRAIPVNVQRLLLDAGFEPPFKSAPQQPAVPVAYLAWRDGKPCWEGDDCVCADAVYPVDHDDDRTSMPVYLAPPPQPRLTDGEIYTAYIEATNQTLRPQDERLAFAFARAIEKKVRGEA